MRTKTLAIIVTGFVVSFACCFIAIAANDTPHNASNNMSCGSCHGETLLDSPFWGGSWTYDDLCLSCHTEPPGGRYTEKNAPFEKTHSDAGGNALAECRDCHNPHYQRQKVYKNTDASNLYLAKGKITSCEYTCPVCPQVIGTTTFTFSTITYKSGWEWNPPTNTKLAAKTGDYRGAILFPNIGKLGYNYPITAVGATTITVKGNAAAFFCPSQTYTCDPPFDPSNQFCCDNPDDSSCLSLQTYSCNLSSPTDFAVIYGQYIKDVIDISPDGSGNNKTVKFLDQVGPKSFADGDGTYDGVCEVCHTQTKYHKNDGSGDSHYATMNCISCHPHTGGFAHGGGGGTGCNSCHGHSGSHYRHTDVDPPKTACGDCHNTGSYPKFADDQDLTNTTVCNTCHSPLGSFNGVNSVNGSVGAKDNWDQGVYEGTYHNILKDGKEKWCAGCHDNDPSVVNEVTAPDIVGDNSTYGYYLSSNAHSNSSYGVSRKNLPYTYSKGECVHCHDVSQSGHGELFDTSVEFCLQCHDSDSETTCATTPIVNRSYSYRAGNYSTDTLDSIKKAFTSFSSHNLSEIIDNQDDMGEDTTFKSLMASWGYTPSSNPCAACHNPHKVQGDPVNAPNSAKSSGTRGYPIVRPSQHNVDYNDLWGDETDEKLNNYTTKYQAPYRKGSTSAYEPDGSSTTNGSNLTDFNTFCTDCHNTTNTIYSTTLGRELRQIDWDNEIHGKGDPNDGSTGYAKLCGDAPYPNGFFGDPPTLANKKVLSCLDCHEPHGSPNVTLIRTEVNGNTLSAITSISQIGCGMGYGATNYDTSMGNLCNRCHNDDYQIDSTCYSGRWYKVHHSDMGDTGCNTDNPYKAMSCSSCHPTAPAHHMDGCRTDEGQGDSNYLSPIGCICCHYHGSAVHPYPDPYYPDNNPKTRRTF
jgi:predicted CXXCH cytochrome family protein